MPSFEFSARVGSYQNRGIILYDKWNISFGVLILDTNVSKIFSSQIALEI